MSAIIQDFSNATKLTDAESARLLGSRKGDSCGVGAVASLSGQPQHSLFLRAFHILQTVEQRGAASADGVSGDGAGFLFTLPKTFFADYLRTEKNLNELSGRVAVGQINFPQAGQQPEAFALGQKIVEETLAKHGIQNFAWRHVKVDTSDDILGPMAGSTLPDIRQIVFEAPAGSEAETENRLYGAMLEIEQRVAESGNPTLAQSFYINSLSSAVINYKAMVKPSNLDRFFSDLGMFRDQQVAISVGLVHQRFATNAAANWKLAHPYRTLAHNGEINTIGETAQDAKARTAGYFTEGQRPIQTTGSDTAQVDTILRAMTAHGWSPLQALRHLIPPALHASQSATYQDYVRVTQALSTQADGPAAMVMTDGLTQLAIQVDRSGLRPLNVTIVGDELIACSEAGSGLLPTDEGKKTSRLLLSGGEAAFVDLKTGEYHNPRQTEEWLAAQGPYSQWVKNIETFAPTTFASESQIKAAAQAPSDRVPAELMTHLKSVGFTEDDMTIVVATLAETANEAMASMGNTKPLAVLSNLPAVHARLSNFFSQRFAQITNPAIDIKEKLSYDMGTRLGDRGDLIGAHPSRMGEKPFDIIEVKDAILTTHQFGELQDLMAKKGLTTHSLDCTFAPKEWRDIEGRIDQLVADAVAAVKGGATQLIVSHRAMSGDRAIIPGMLMVSAIDKALEEHSLRHKVNIHAEVADVHDTHTFSQNITSGADTVIPFLTEQLILHTYRPTDSDPDRSEKALKAYTSGMVEGLMKIMGKKGDTTLNSYRGGHEHSVWGLDRAFIEKYFGNSDRLVSPFSGMTAQQLAYSIARNHTDSFSNTSPSLLHPMGRRSEAEGGADLHTQTAIRLLGIAVDPQKGGFDKFLAYAEEANTRGSRTIVMPDGDQKKVLSPILVRDLLGLKDADEPLSMVDVQSPLEIVQKHFRIAPMSYGALGIEAVTVLNKVGEDLGMGVNSGEGGELPELPYKSSIKQVASGRFGVTIEYLNNAIILQIKAAQGAKPGEGGELPGHKVTEDIARARNATPGVPLISPPPHHDIYSIEDLNQLFRDLKAANPKASISVKLVADIGVDEVAAGAAKCGIGIDLSGHDGGTGAAKFTSIMHAGGPIEYGMAAVQQNLVRKGFRAATAGSDVPDLVPLWVDGSIRTGRDVVIAGIFADGVNLGTSILEAAGCLMVRQCHSGTCPVGIATQDPAYRAKLHTDAEQRVRNFALFLAQDTARWLAKLGVRSFEDLRGRTDLLVDRRLVNPQAYSDQVLKMDLAPILHVASSPDNIQAIRASREKHTKQETTLNDKLWAEIEAKLTNDNTQPIDVTAKITNTDLSVGTFISGEVHRRRKAGQVIPHITINLEGIAGQSVGAFVADGITINASEANDYVGKGLGKGGKIVIRNPANQNTSDDVSVAQGQACLIGATGGEFYSDGKAGARFAVRNSGAEAVVMGAGDWCSEFMTNGFVAYLDKVGKGALVGHSGGIAFFYDPKASNDSPAGSTYVNDAKTGLPVNFDAQGRQIVRLDGTHAPLQHDEGYADKLRSMIERHFEATQSPKSGRILENWSQEVGNFWVAIPDQYAAARKKMLAPKAAPALALA